MWQIGNSAKGKVIWSEIINFDNQEQRVRKTSADDGRCCHLGIIHGGIY